MRLNGSEDCYGGIVELGAAPATLLSSYRFIDNEHISKAVRLPCLTQSMPSDEAPTSRVMPTITRSLAEVARLGPKARVPSQTLCGVVRLLGKGEENMHLNPLQHSLSIPNLKR